jgi:hypothetical protein
MRFPVNFTRQKRCPICKAAGPGTRPPATPRPETATLSFAVYHQRAKRQAGPVVFGGDLFLGWDAGVGKHPRSGTSLGAAVRVARTKAPTAGGGLQMYFCSISCLRQFLLAAMDELERRATAVEPQVQAARERASAQSGATPARGGTYRIRT